MNTKKGIFISFEGGEGCGKTTQIRKLAGFLKERGHEVVTTREPGGTHEAEKIRELLVQREGGNWSETAECLLFFAARAMHVRDLIKPALSEGKIVLSDRFTDSTRAYQSYGHGFPLSTVEQVKELSIGDFEPDLTLILDIEPITGIERSERRLTENSAPDLESTEDRFERLDLSFHKSLRQGYLEIAADNPERCKVLDANQGIEELAGQIGNIVLEKLEDESI
jgi:dTMP kinase